MAKCSSDLPLSPRPGEVADLKGLTEGRRPGRSVPLRPDAPLRLRFDPAPPPEERIFGVSAAKPRCPKLRVSRRPPCIGWPSARRSRPTTSPWPKPLNAVRIAAP